jgi:membrane protease subunit (stomatin/prohibitin family)
MAGSQSINLTDQLRDMVVARFTDVLGESKIPALDLASNYDELGKFITARIQPDFETFGVTIVKFFVENISLPPEVEAALDKRTSMGVIGNLNAYTQYQAANAIQDAAKNPSGVAASGVGLGMGVGMGQQISEAIRGNQSAPPPLPQSAAYFVAVNGQQSGPMDAGKLAEDGPQRRTHTRHTRLEKRHGAVDRSGRGPGVERIVREHAAAVAKVRIIQHAQHTGA